MNRFIAFLVLTLIPAGSPAEEMLDLTKAVVVSPMGAKGPEAKAAQALVEEVAKRSHVQWQVWERSINGMTIINVYDAKQPGKPDGYEITIGGNVVTVKGNDARGTLFGV